MTNLQSWKKGDPYCGTFNEALDYAFTLYGETGIDFLRDWREGNLEGWDGFKFAPCPHDWTPWETTGYTGDWFHPRIIERDCKTCHKHEIDDV